MPLSAIARLRKLCLALPEAHEVDAWSEPTVRVRKKMFAMFARKDSHHGAGRNGVWVKATASNQSLMVDAQPERSSYRRTLDQAAGSACGSTHTRTGRNSAICWLTDIGWWLRGN
jgi:hypothetical protein